MNMNIIPDPPMDGPVFYGYLEVLRFTSFDTPFCIQSTQEVITRPLFVNSFGSN